MVVVVEDALAGQQLVLAAAATRVPSEVGYAAYFGPRSAELARLTATPKGFGMSSPARMPK